MDPSKDTNADIWTSEAFVESWTAKAGARERKSAPQWRFMGELLPFDAQSTFTFLDLGAGTGAAAREILSLYPRSTAILADFSPQMMSGGAGEMQPFEGRFQYVPFDMVTGPWPGEIPAKIDAVVTSMCIHHMPDHRKRGLFAEIFGRLVPGGWYINYDSVSSESSVVEAAWQRVNDRNDPGLARSLRSRTPLEQAGYENHVRFVIPLPQQLEYLRSAGFVGVDVYWKRLEDVIYAGRRPA